MKPLTLYFLLVCIMLASVVGVAYIYQSNQVLQYREIAITYEVRDDKSLGFDTTNQSLAFGRMAPGGKSFRHIELVSAVPAEFFIGISGDAKGVVRPDPSQGLLEPGVPIKVSFTVYAPEEPGNYTGLAQVRILRR